MNDSLIHINEYLDLLFAYGPVWVYVVVFSACFVENLFPPFPGDTFILAGGGLVAVGRLDLALCLLSVISGGLCSVMLLYVFGRKYGRSFFIRKDYRYFSASDIYRMESGFRRWGVLLLVFSRFVVGARSALALVAGIGRYPVLGMFIYSLISYFLFTGLVMYIALVLVENIEAVAGYFRTYELVIWPILIVLVVVWVVRRIGKRRKAGAA